MNKGNRMFIVVLSLVLIVTFIPVVAFAETPSGNEDIAPTFEKEDLEIEPSGNCLPEGTFDLVTLDDVATGQPVARQPGKKGTLTTKSTDDMKRMPLLITVIGFNDTPYNTDYDWNSTIFSDDSSSWSLYRYYKDNSQGKFSFAPATESSEYNVGGNTNTKDKINDGIVHVSVDMDHDDWTSMWRSGGEGEHRDSWAAALSAAMAEADNYVDFSRYDTDKDGEIENNEMALGLIIAGGEASLDNNRGVTDDNYLTWAHAWHMAGFMDKAPVCDGKTVDNYIAIAENLRYFRYNQDNYSPSWDSYLEPFSEEWTNSQQIGISESLDVTDAGVFKFTPESSGWYAFYDSSQEQHNAPAILRVINSKAEKISYYIWGEDKTHFYGEEGKQYYLQIGSFTNGNEYTVQVGSSDGPEYLFASQAGMHSLAHELGHYLGLPDYYDVNHDDSGEWGDYKVGYISPMASGNWCYVWDDESEIDDEGSFPTFRPCAFDAYSRVALGWVDPVDASVNGTYTVTAQDFSDNSGYKVLKIPTGDTNEYYLVENRQYSGWDEGLKNRYFIENYDDQGVLLESLNEKGGIVIWHVDDDVIEEYDSENEINTTTHRPGLMPTYMEYDGSVDEPVYKFIGKNVDINRLFFDEEVYTSKYAATAGETIFLPVYSNTEDKTSARTQNLSGKGLSLECTGNTIKIKITGAPAHTHTLTSTDAKAATCENAGNKAYWTCSGCKKYFSDANGEHEVKKDSWVINPLGHSYGAWTKINDKQHQRVCSKDSSHIEKANHTWDSGKTTTEPTGTKKGVKTYTCTVCKATRTEEIPAKGSTTPPPSVAAPAVPAEIVDLPAVKISKPKVAKTKITVRWKKPSKNNIRKIQGIEIKVTGPNGERNTTAGKKKTSKKVGGLLSKQRYTVKVRAYAYIGGAKHVSAWKSKFVKTK